MAEAESEDEPLQRGEQQYPQAKVTFQGELPPGFDGPVGGHVQGIFRPLALQLQPGTYEISLDGSYVPAGGREVRRPILSPYAICVGSFLCVWLRNATDQWQPFKVELLGHTADLTASEGHELCHEMKLGVGCARYRPTPSPDLS